jgi:hypothetical protein
MHGSNVQQQIGEELFYYIKNQSGATINNGRVVRAAGTLGSSGKILGEYMIADGSIEEKFTLGVATEDIINGDDGYVTEFGLVRGIDATGSPYGETWNDGDVLWVSTTIAGGLTNVEPIPPNLKIEMAIVIHNDANGSIFVRPNRYPHFHDLQEATWSGGTESNLDIIQWSDDLSGWIVTSTPILNSMSATTISGGTIYSGGTNLTEIFSPITHTHDISDITGFTDNSTEWNSAYDDTITGMTVTGTTTKTITLEQRDGGVIQANFTDLSISGGTGTDDYTTGSTLNGTLLEFTRISGGTYNVELSGLTTGSTGSNAALIFSPTGNTSGIIISGRTASNYGPVGADARDLSSSGFGAIYGATGNKSMAWGGAVIASGQGSTAFGKAPTASGNYSTAFGNGSTASGAYSLAWGASTTASGATSTAWGNTTNAYGNYSTAWGKGTTASGNYSTAWGFSSTASAYFDTAWGINTTASGNYSTAFGSSTTASGTHSTAFGKSSDAAGDFSTAWGGTSTASADYGTAWGVGTFAIGKSNSTAWGDGSTASNYQSTAFGNNTTASGVGSTAWGNGSTASGLYSTAFGATTTASGATATAWGKTTIAGNNYATARGASTTASGAYSTAWGDATQASGLHSTAFGTNSIASGDYSLATGSNNTASGTFSMSWGCNNVASGVHGTAMGDWSVASGENSTAFGLYNIAPSYVETNIGMYSTTGNTIGNPTGWTGSDRIFNIGNGQSTGSTSDALTVYKDGKIEAPSLVISGITGNTQLITKEFADDTYGGNVYAFGSLPTGFATQRAFVNDASATTFHSIVAGGGANYVPVFYDGTNWRIG